MVEERLSFGSWCSLASSALAAAGVLAGLCAGPRARCGPFPAVDRPFADYFTCEQLAVFKAVGRLGGAWGFSSEDCALAGQAWPADTAPALGVRGSLRGLGKPRLT